MASRRCGARIADRLPRHPVHHLDHAPRAAEADHPQVAGHELGDHRRRLGQRRRALARLGVEQRRVPQGDGALRPGGAVAADDLDQVADQLRHHLGRVRHRRRCEQELRRRADRGADAAQTADHVGDVRAEHAPVDVRLVDHDVRQVREHVAPAVGVRADADVQHVGVRQQQVRVPARHRAGRAGRCRRRTAPAAARGPGAATSASAPGPGPAPSSATGTGRGRGDPRAAPRSPAGRTRASCRWPCR